MKIKIPEKFMGIDIAGSMEIDTTEPNNNSSAKVNLPKAIARDIEGYIFVPSMKKYFSKERRFLGLNWNKTHEALDNFRLKMPTIPQFLEYIKYLQNDYPNRDEAKKILEDILKPGEIRGEFLDARFDLLPEKMNIYYGHQKPFIQGVPIPLSAFNGIFLPQHREELQSNITEECFVDFFENSDSQGMPTKKSASQKYQQGKNVYYNPPQDNSVTELTVDSSRLTLNCRASLEEEISERGVFPYSIPDNFLEEIK